MAQCRPIYFGGHYLEFAPSGGRWWRFAYRFLGKRNLISIGVFQDVPLAVARERRDAMRKLLADGKDPSAKRKTDKRKAAWRAANSFEVVAREWYQKHAHSWVLDHECKTLQSPKLFAGARSKALSSCALWPLMLALMRRIEPSLDELRLRRGLKSA